MLRPGIVGMRGSVVIRLRPCTNGVHPPPAPRSPIPAGKTPTPFLRKCYAYLPPQPSPPHDPSQRPSFEPAASPAGCFFFFSEDLDFLPRSWSPPTKSTEYKVLKISRNASKLIQNIPGKVLSRSSDASAGLAAQRGEDGPQSPRYCPGSSPRV